MPKPELLQVGKIAGVFGIKGWLKVTSYTQPKDNILDYPVWLLRKSGNETQIKVVKGQAQGSGIVVSLEGIHDRDQALTLIGSEILIRSLELPPLKEGEFYWADLIGLAVENLEGVALGEVISLFETGANDVLIVKGERERAIPFLQQQTVKSVDLNAGRIIVDWDADF